MNLPEEAPKLPVFPFVVGDAVLLVTAVLIGRYCEAPIGPGPLLAIALCVIAGAALAALPFVVNYAKRQDAELTERQNQIAALARTTSESAEQLSIAAAGLHGIAQATSANLKPIEQFPAKLEAHLNEREGHSPATPGPPAPATDEAPRIDAAAARLTQAVADLAHLEAATRAHLASIDEALARFAAQAEKTAAHAGEQLAASATTALLEANALALADFKLQLAAAVTRAIASVETTLAEAPMPTNAPPEAGAPDGHALPQDPAPADQAPGESPPVPPVAEETSSLPADPSPDEVPVAELSKPRIRQPKPALADSGFDLGLSVDASENETSLSSDGFTRLIATAYIGIGNKLFIRGEGPGLSWEKGVPLQFVSIGKWRWETAEAVAPVRAKLYKNDQTECTSVGAIALEPGHQHEVNAGF